MTTLTVPSLEGRLLQTVKEEVDAQAVREWPRESVELCLVLLRRFRDRFAGLRGALDELLASGVEAGSFARDGTRLLAAADDFATSIHELIEKLSASEDAASARLVAELHALAGEAKAYRERFAEALARVATPPPGLDWDRLKQEADADFATGIACHLLEVGPTAEFVGPGNAVAVVGQSAA
ncbi:MAG: hypothetical protein ACRELF_17765 [Gemmataceae bacterium]